MNTDLNTENSVYRRVRSVSTFSPLLMMDEYSSLPARWQDDVKTRAKARRVTMTGMTDHEAKTRRSRRDRETTLGKRKADYRC